MNAWILTLAALIFLANALAVWSCLMMARLSDQRLSEMEEESSADSAPQRPRESSFYLAAESDLCSQHSQGQRQNRWYRMVGRVYGRTCSQFPPGSSISRSTTLNRRSENQ